MGPVAAVVGAVAAVVGTVSSYSAQKDAAKAAKRSRAEQLKQQQIATRRSRRQSIRAMQISRAQAIASAGASGAYGSSSATGGIGSLGSQLGAEFGYSTTMSGLSRNISMFEQQGADARGRAAMWGDVAGLGMTVFQGAGGFNRETWQKTSPTRAAIPNYDPRVG